MPNDLTLRILGNFLKILEMLGFDGEYPAVQPKAKCWHFLVKNCKKSVVKYSIEKPILLNFVNSSLTLFLRLWKVVIAICQKLRRLIWWRQWLLKLFKFSWCHIVMMLSDNILQNTANLTGFSYQSYCPSVVSITLTQK